MKTVTQGKNGQEYEGKETLLGRCLVEGDPETTLLARRARRKNFGVSLAIELSLLGLLVAAPLFSSTAQTQLKKIVPPQLAFFGEWHQHIQTQRAAPSATPRGPEISSPIRAMIFPVATVNPWRGQETADPPIPGMPEGDAGGPVLSAGIIGGPQPIEPPHIATPPPQEKHPLKLSEGVLQAQLISRIEPRYPALAIQTRTEGTVQLHAIIGRDGRITALDVISGHPLLVKAALDAVRQWAYRPTMLNGEPVEVETSIIAIFKLHS
jgi:TonB family protein